MGRRTSETNDVTTAVKAAASLLDERLISSSAAKEAEALMRKAVIQA